MKCPKCGKDALRKTSTSDGSIVSYVHGEMNTKFGRIANDVCHIESPERKAAYEIRRAKIKEARKK